MPAHTIPDGCYPEIEMILTTQSSPSRPGTSSRRPAVRWPLLVLASCFIPQSAAGQGRPNEAPPTAADSIPPADIFRAAGFALVDGAWTKCGDPGTASYEPGSIMQRGDFNGDGSFDAFVTEGSTFCFGMTGTGYTLVTRRQDGTWRVMDERTGVPHLLTTKGTDGWPDIEVGGPGFCFPVLRWNGKQYALNRRQYEGSPCR